MEKQVLSEIHRIKELMGNSNLILETNGRVLGAIEQAIESLITKEGDDAIELVTKIAKGADRELDDAIKVIKNSKKTGAGRPSESQIDNAYNVILRKVDYDTFVSRIIAQGHLPTPFKQGMETLLDKLKTKEIFAPQYDKLVDSYVEQAMGRANGEIKTAFKNYYKSLKGGGFNITDEVNNIKKSLMAQESPIFKKTGLFLDKYQASLDEMTKLIEKDIASGVRTAKEINDAYIKWAQDRVNTILNNKKISAADKSAISKWWAEQTPSKMVKNSANIVVLIAIITGIIWLFNKVGDIPIKQVKDAVNKVRGGDSSSEDKKPNKPSDDNTKTPDTGYDPNDPTTWK